MKVKTLIDGHDGTNAYGAGEEIETSADHAVFLFRLGYAEPLDDEAAKAAIVADEHGPLVIEATTTAKAEEN